MLINVLTYNISWATQVNKLLGSEADFVEECQKKYKKGGLQCTKNAINNIKKLDKLDLIALQEVNSNIEKKIMKSQTNLKNFKRGKIGLSNVSTLWNPDIFGELLTEEIINLIEGDDRPCLILVLKKNNQIFVIINMHMPKINKRIEALKILNSFINKNKKINQHLFNEKAKIIILGDFNDIDTRINKNKPLILKNSKKTIRLTYNKTKKESKKTLKSCCWLKHKPYDFTGDYILVNKNIIQKSIEIPEIFKNTGKAYKLYSDHMPVFSTLKI
jgi:exonuclease III